MAYLYPWRSQDNGGRGKWAPKSPRLAEHQKPNRIEKQELNDFAAARHIFLGFCVQNAFAVEAAPRIQSGSLQRSRPSSWWGAPKEFLPRSRPSASNFRSFGARRTENSKFGPPNTTSWLCLDLPVYTKACRQKMSC